MEPSSSALSKCAAHLASLAPNSLLFSEAGQLPHITADQLRLLGTRLANRPLHLFLSDIFPLLKSVQSPTQLDRCGIFNAIKHTTPIVVSLQNPLVESHVQASKDSMSLWSTGGRFDVSAKLLSQVASRLRIDGRHIVMQVPCQLADTMCTGIPRQERYLSATRQYLRRFTEDASDSLPNILCTIPISLVDFDEQLSGYIAYVLDELNADVIGFVVDASGGRGDDLLDRIRQLRKRLLSIAPGKLLFFVGQQVSMSKIAEFFRAGIDFIDSSSIAKESTSGHLLVSPSERIQVGERSLIERLEAPTANCECYTCRSYTLSYLAHLQLSKELLAPTLLTVHNMQLWLRHVDEARCLV